MTDMPQTILAATDFSKPAERACDFARDLSRRFQARADSRRSSTWYT